MSSRSTFKVLPIKHLGKAAAVATPVVFIAEFAHYVVEPLEPRSIFVAPILLVITLAILFAWYRQVKPIKKAYQEGKLTKRQYEARTSNSLLAKWFSFCVVALCIFGALAGVKLWAIKQKQSWLVHYPKEAVRFVQERIPSIKKRIIKEGPEVFGGTIGIVTNAVGVATREASVVKSNFTGMSSDYYKKVQSAGSNLLNSVRENLNSTSNQPSQTISKDDAPHGATNASEGSSSP